MDDEHVRRIAHEAGREGAREVLTTIGIEAENPREAQEDFVFLRQWRRGSNAIKGRIMAAAITIAISAALYAFYIGIKQHLKG